MTGPTESTKSVFWGQVEYLEWNGFIQTNLCNITGGIISAVGAFYQLQGRPSVRMC